MIVDTSLFFLTGKIQECLIYCTTIIVVLKANSKQHITDIKRAKAHFYSAGLCLQELYRTFITIQSIRRYSIFLYIIFMCIWAKRKKDRSYKLLYLTYLYLTVPTMKWIAVLYLQLTSVFLNVVIPFGVDAFVTRSLAGRSRSTTNIRETILDENDPFELPDPRWICPLQTDVCVETGVTLSRYSTLQTNRQFIQSVN